MVDEISQPRCKAPIIETVLNGVAKRHCAVRKSMHKQRFDQSFDIVERMAKASQVHNGMGTGAEFMLFLVDKRQAGIEEQVDEERACILRQEHRSPANLGAKVFEVEGCGGADRERLQHFVIPDAFSLGI